MWIKDLSTLHQLVNGSKGPIFCRNKIWEQLILIFIQGNPASFIYSFSRQSLSSAICQVLCLPSLLIVYLGKHSSSWMHMCTHTSSRRTQLIIHNEFQSLEFIYLIPQRFHIHLRFNSVLDYSMWVMKYFSWRAKDSLQVEETQRWATWKSKDS